MADLEELASRLSVLAARLSDHSRVEDRFERLTTSTERLSSLARRLERAAEFIIEARRDGLSNDSDVAFAGRGTVVEALRGALAAVSPAAGNEPDPLPLDRLDTQLEPLVQGLEAAARRAWRQYATSVVLQGEAELLSALARIPGLQPQVEALRRLQDRIRNLLTRDLPTAAQYQQLRTAVAEHVERWAGLPISDNPDVIRFLRRAAAGGASLEELDRVRAWLTEQGLAKQFIVRPGVASP